MSEVNGNGTTRETQSGQTWQIRRAAAQDIPQIMALLVEVNMVHHNGRPDLFKGPTTKYTEEELAELLQDDTRPVFVCDDGEGRILGHAFTVFQEEKGSNLMQDMRTLYIDDICVDEKARGLHVGAGLYEHVATFAKESGCYHITLNVWECNPGARAFYEKMGLTPYRTGMEKIL